MEMKKSKVSIQFLLIFRQSADVLFFLYARRLRGYTATASISGAEKDEGSCGDSKQGW